jgi:hypothetical protein
MNFKCLVGGTHWFKAEHCYFEIRILSNHDMKYDLSSIFSIIKPSLPNSQHKLFLTRGVELSNLR